MVWVALGPAPVSLAPLGVVAGVTTGVVAGVLPVPCAGNPVTGPVLSLFSLRFSRSFVNWWAFILYWWAFILYWWVLNPSPSHHSGKGTFSLSQSLLIVLLSWDLKLFLSHLLDIPNFSCKLMSASIISSPLPCAGNLHQGQLSHLPQDLAQNLGHLDEELPHLASRCSFWSWFLGLAQARAGHTPSCQTNRYHPGTSAPLSQ